MKHINNVFVPRKILNETSNSLRDYGKKGCECLVLWLGHINDNGTSSVESILVPPQESIKSEDGVGYFVNSETLFRLNKLLSSTGLRLIAQVHSHPGRAYHSTADDRYCIVTIEGGFSLVVPDFGFRPPDLLQWATYRLINGTWQKLPVKSVEAIFLIEGNPENKSATTNGFLTKISKLFT